MVKESNIVSGVFVEMIVKPGLSLSAIGRFTGKRILPIALLGLFLILSTIFVFAKDQQRVFDLCYHIGVSDCSKGRAAVVTFLANQFNGRDNDNDDDDVYYVGARLIAYQLLHAPETRFLNPTPLIVLVTHDVRPSKRQRLMDDGAIVVEVNNIDHDIPIWEPRWVDAFTKMRVFDPKLVPYGKVLYVDTDIIFTRPIDDSAGRR
ncbi:hypothetical protein Egran_03811 [Elaphomyces granulatus]|uniref:Nucleotide-diphospho-sugar transferase domain-containing protein n=1 Tax=Elaphomyces granulatus TaxID=519963 RepID=A0A232LWD5_9EURO|nr:hypothetical protein Egran_03811 [Elaphomyces granulatus]